MFYFLLFKRQILDCVYDIVLEKAELAGYILNRCKFAFLSPPVDPQASRFHVNINIPFFFLLLLLMKNEVEDVFHAVVYRVLPSKVSINFC